MAPRFTSAQLRSALGQLAASPQFLGSSGGRAFVRQLELHLVPSMIAMARQVGLGGSWLVKDEVVNSVIIGLCEQEGRVARHIASVSLDPWGYLAKCSAKWVRALGGTRGIPIESQELIVESGDLAETYLTPINDVARLTHTLLAPHTAAHLREPLLPLLRWLAHNPPQRRSHEAADRAAAVAQFSEFTTERVAAVMNIAWGGRPKRRETSLMAALLMNPDFLPSDSPSHARALLHYRRAMRSRSLVAGFSELQERRAA